MAVHSRRFLFYGRNLFTRGWVDNAQIAVALIDYQQGLSACAQWKHSEKEDWQQ
jgi:hypothetical protein